MCCGFGENFVKNNAEAENSFLNDGDVVPVKQERALIIFIKNPEKGKVKTRLAKTLGDEKALAAYHDMLKHTRETTSQVDSHRALYYSSFVDTNDDWSNADFHKVVQVQGDLGHKMASAFQDLFAQGFQEVLIIGSDCLNLKPQHLEQAFRMLKHEDFVLGPANDGGYYLLGMRSFEPSVFKNKTWSTETVLSSTLEDIQNLSKTVHLLPELIDVDNESDYLAALDTNAKRA